jgi:hypothetical protein
MNCAHGVCVWVGVGCGFAASDGRPMEVSWL